ncbi:MAG: polysaccharide biosynthesis protein [Acidobacteriaceae bacterium]
MPSDFSSPSQPFNPTNWAEILGRPPSPSEPLRIPSAAATRILVTGAGGFIGSEMVRVFAASGAAHIVLLDTCEQHLFEVHAALAAPGYAVRCTPILGSVCDRPLLDALFAEHRPQLILHAAALKHVLLMEQNPLAAVATNTLGTATLTEAATAQGARHLILVSTDKAVAPHSIMGASKHIAEQIMLVPDRHMRKTAVRLVNVIGSPCSVGPLFSEQIARGGPVTVTHPAANRFFLTLSEVTSLLAEAIESEASGLLIPNPHVTGEPILIADLARRMIAASRRNSPIVFTQPRPGEKQDESLVAPNETLAEPATPSLNRVEGPTTPNLAEHLQALEAAIAALDRAETVRLVQHLVPGYQPSALLRDCVSEPLAARS